MVWPPWVCHFRAHTCASPFFFKPPRAPLTGNLPQCHKGQGGSRPNKATSPPGQPSRNNIKKIKIMKKETKHTKAQSPKGVPYKVAKALKTRTEGDPRAIKP